jgi:hypothetical protein
MARGLVKLCSRCGLEREHGHRADNPAKPRPTCRTCQAASTKAWRAGSWQRRKAYDTWKGMIARCHDPRTNRFWPGTGVPAYRDYGERGIRVCRRWRGKRGFLRFLEDVGYPPTPTCSLDRARSGRGYSRTNARWASRDEQNRNRRGVRVITAACPRSGEVLSLCMAEWDRRLGLTRGTVRRRLGRGWSETGALAGEAPERQLQTCPF